MTRSINAAKCNGHISVIGVRSGFGMTTAIAVEPVVIKFGNAEAAAALMQAQTHVGKIAIDIADPG